MSDEKLSSLLARRQKLMNIRNHLNKCNSSANHEQRAINSQANIIENSDTEMEIQPTKANVVIPNSSNEISIENDMAYEIINTSTLSLSRSHSFFKENRNSFGSAIIEREIKKLIVWGPSQWPSFMESARKRPHAYRVNVLGYQDFFDFNDFAESVFTPATLKNKDLHFSKIRVCTFKKSNLKIAEVKYTMLEDGTTHKIELCKAMQTGRRTVKGKGKGKGLAKNDQPELESTSNLAVPTSIDSLPFLYKERLPISVPKYKDLKNLCVNGIIPNRFHNEYLNLPNKSITKDRLNDTDDDETDKDND